jgi:hypothetical protein
LYGGPKLRYSLLELSGPKIDPSEKNMGRKTLRIQLQRAKQGLLRLFMSALLVLNRA